MGGEQTRKRKYLLLYFACCIGLVLGTWGCASFPVRWKGKGGPGGAESSFATGKRHLATARTLLAQGKYEASLRKTKEVLGSYPRTLGDEALAQMGLIYAYANNPDQDYRRSLECFRRLMREFPQSRLKGQAEVWVFLLQEAVDKDIMFQQEIRNKDKSIGNLKKKNNHLKVVLKKEKARINELEKRAKRLEDRIDVLVAEAEKLKEQLSKLKEIDLGIEERKSKAQ